MTIIITIPLPDLTILRVDTNFVMYKISQKLNQFSFLSKR